MTKRFKVGDKVKCGSAALENECYRKFWNDILTIEAVSTAYMPAKQFFDSGKPKGFHPGYDSGTNSALYDLKGIPVSLYDWELERV